MRKMLKKLGVVIPSAVLTLLMAVGFSTPAFAYVDQLLKMGSFQRLRGLLYFTDGYGMFPAKMPPYDTAFIFMKDDYRDVDVPPWAIKLILDTKALERERTAEHYEY